MCHSALSNNPQLYITQLFTKMWLVVYVLIDAHPPLVGWGGVEMCDHEFINDMLLIVVIEASDSVEYYNYLR